MTATCTIEDCDRVHHARGWCQTHYMRWARWGSVDAVNTTRGLPVEQRFWMKVDRRGDDECWPWKAALAAGYGRFVFGKASGAHRFSYELHVGPIPDGLELDHLCRNPACVNPRHLEPVTPRENQARSPLTFTGIYASKTHCIHGHPFDDENTWVDRHGHRVCRTCKRRVLREWRARDRMRSR